MNAGATRTIGVPLSSSAIAYLRSNGPTALDVLADTNGTSGSVNGYQNAGATLTVAAPR